MPTDPAAMNPFSQFIPLILVFFIFYFIVIRPQKAKQSEFKKMLTELKKNDTVVVAGIHGTIVNVKDTTVVVRIDDNVKIEVDKESIGSVNKATATA